jgi:hypothetical protein
MSTRDQAELSREDFEVLRRAKDILEHPGLPAQLANVIGLPLEKAMRSLPRKWSAIIQRATERSLLAGLEAALTSVDTQRAVPKIMLRSIADIARSEGERLGAAGGAAINLLFIKHFQDMAWAHFTIRRLERTCGSERVEHAYRDV